MLLSEKTKEIGLISLGWKSNISPRLIKKLEQELNPVIDDMFKDAIVESNLIVKKEVAALANDYNLPIKYNKDLLMTFNTDKSIYTGFYDDVYKSGFKKSEINRLKSTILRAKYSNLSESQLIREIQSTINVSKQRALVIARQETARLDTAAKSIYYNNKKVQEKYDKVWVSQSDARPSHKAMDGQIADSEGYFTTPDGDKVQGPPLGFGCRCRVTLEKK